MIQNGYEYEKWCAGWLASEGYHHIVRTHASHDQGIDILAEKHHHKTGFQCKYYDRPVGNAAVQQAYTGAAYYDCEKAAVLTNSTFTDSARQLAERLNVDLYAHIVPERKPACIRLKRTAAPASIAASTGLFLYAAVHPGMDMRQAFIFFSMPCFAGSFLLLMADKSSALCIFACIILLFPLAILINNHNEVLLLCGILLLLTLTSAVINAADLLKKQNVRNGNEEKREIRQNQKELLRKYGQKTGTLIEGELHASLALQNAYIKKNQVILEYLADGNIQEDIPLIDWSLNQFFPDRNWEVNMLGSRRLIVKTADKIKRK